MPPVTRPTPPRVAAAPVLRAAVPRQRSRPATTTPARPRRTWRTDVAMAAVAVGGALWVTSRLWIDPAGRGLAANGADQAQGEWLLRLVADAVIHGRNPFYTHLANAPTGVNLADNTATTLLGTLLIPVTLWFGAPAAFVAGLAGNLAASAYAWYHALSRHVARGPAAAVAGGLFCGFAPAMIAHANGHLNFTAQWLVPVLLWRLLRLARAGARRWEPVVVGLLVAAQYSLGAEMLFIVAVAVTVFVVAWFTALDPRPRRYVTRRVLPRAVRRTAVAALVAAALLAYPIWMQFAGPHAYRGSAFSGLGVWENAASFVGYPTGSLAGANGLATGLARNVGEENSFLGPLLAGFAVFAAAWFARRRSAVRHPVGRALAVTAAVLALISMGPRLQIGGWRSTVPLPWHLLQHVPLFRDALPGRFALMLVPIVAVWLVLAIDGVRAYAGPDRRFLRAVAVLLALGALLPLLPAPIATVPRAPLPRFFTSGDWRRYIPAGTTVVSVPPARWDSWDGQRWQVAAGLAFDIEGGYVLAPGRDGRGTPDYAVAPTAALLSEVAATGRIPVVDPATRARARADLAWWHASAVILPDAVPGFGHEWAAHHDALLATARKLFGVPVRVDDVWLWRA